MDSRKKDNMHDDNYVLMMIQVMAGHPTDTPSGGHWKCSKKNWVRANAGLCMKRQALENTNITDEC